MYQNNIKIQKFGKKFIKPLYDSYCFSKIPKTIGSLLNGIEDEGLPNDVYPGKKHKQYKKVVFILVDAFGWKFFEKYKDRYPFLQRFIKKGAVSKLTAQFPSTTSAEITTMNSGLTVGESGVYEWFYYEPKLDSVIAPLLFSHAGDGIRGTLLEEGVIPEQLFPFSTLYEKFNSEGIESNIFISKEYSHSEYNSVLSKGGIIHPYKSLAEGLTTLSEVLVSAKDKSYFYFYYGAIDSIGHEHGADSRYFDSEVDSFFTSIENILMKFIDGKVKETIILVSADHGQNNVLPQNTFYLNREIKDIKSYFNTTKDGKPIVPAGSCRDMFLHVKEVRIDDLEKILKGKLQGRAEIHKTEKLVKEGFFGKNISKEFSSRVGNLIILPYAGESVWWYEKDIFEQDHIGNHGGLTRDEMEIPFLALSL